MNSPLFRIKICGLTNTADATAAVRAGADAIGLNFFSRSKRFITVHQASLIVRDVPREIVKVGVFVDPSHAEIDAALRTGAIDMVQLHGEETPEFIAAMRDVATIKAFRWDPATTPQRLTPYLSDCERLRCLPAALLLDANVPGEFGGTSEVADWASIAQWRTEAKPAIPIVLAGGLTADNVDAAIHAVRPDAVDTASGVEESPRKKDEARMGEFVNAAKCAWNSGG